MKLAQDTAMERHAPLPPTSPQIDNQPKPWINIGFWIVGLIFVLAFAGAGLNLYSYLQRLPAIPKKPPPPAKEQLLSRNDDPLVPESVVTPDLDPIAGEAMESVPLHLPETVTATERPPELEPPSESESSHRPEKTIGSENTTDTPMAPSAASVPSPDSTPAAADPKTPTAQLKAGGEPTNWVSEQPSVPSRPHFPAVPDLSSHLRKGEYSAAARRFQEGLAPQSSQFTIRLEVACQPDTLQRALEHADFHPALYILPRQVDQRACYALLWGLYETDQAALEAREHLPAYFRELSPPPQAVQLKIYYN